MAFPSGAAAGRGEFRQRGIQGDVVSGGSGDGAVLARPQPCVGRSYRSILWPLAFDSCREACAGVGSCFTQQLAAVACLLGACRGWVSRSALRQKCESSLGALTQRHPLLQAEYRPRRAGAGAAPMRCSGRSLPFWQHYRQARISTAARPAAAAVAMATAARSKGALQPHGRLAAMPWQGSAAGAGGGASRHANS